jgi:hypothetical protein
MYYMGLHLRESVNVYVYNVPCMTYGTATIYTRFSILRVYFNLNPNYRYLYCTYSGGYDHLVQQAVRRTSGSSRTTSRTRSTVLFVLLVPYAHSHDPNIRWWTGQSFVLRVLACVGAVRGTDPKSTTGFCRMTPGYLYQVLCYTCYIILERLEYNCTYLIDERLNPLHPRPSQYPCT